MPGGSGTTTKLVLTGGGALLIWSALKGRKWTQSLRDLISGRPPALAETTSIVSPSPDGGSSGASGGGGVSPSGPGERAWIVAFLTSMGAPPTSANINSMSSWIRHEFSSWPPAAKNNPMATTQKEPGSTTYNSAGVQNYPNAAEGIAALRTTLLNGRYPGIVAALRSGKGLCGSNLSSEFLTWSGNGYAGVC